MATVPHAALLPLPLPPLVPRLIVATVLHVTALHVTALHDARHHEPIAPRPTPSCHCFRDPVSPLQGSSPKTTRPARQFPPSQSGYVERKRCFILLIGRELIQTAVVRTGAHAHTPWIACRRPRGSAPALVGGRRWLFALREVAFLLLHPPVFRGQVRGTRSL